MVIRASSIGGIPFGDTAGRPAAQTGQPYFNGEAARLELYTQNSGWQNIVQETPGVSSISGTYLESAGTGTITISGTNFVSGCYATAIGTNGVQYDATTTTFNSIVQITATFTGLSNAYEPYDIKVTNPSNLFGIIPDALYINAAPAWQTAAGSLGTFADFASMTVSATATDPESTITYSLASGSSLPSGITLNSSTGVISGTTPDVLSNTTYTFTINASDGLNTVVPRTFNFTVNAAPTWVTNAGSLGTFATPTSISIQLSATDPSETLSYSLFSGSLPSGTTLSSSGLISGNLSEVPSDTISTFTVSISDGTQSVLRTFSILSVSPTVFYAPFTSNNVETNSNVSPTQNINGGIQSIAGYSGLRLNSQKTAFDGNVSSISRMTGSNWTVEYWIYKNSTTSSATEIEVGSGSSFYVTGLLARPGDPYLLSNQLNWPRARTTGQWVHVAYVGDNGIVREYENGTQVNSRTINTTISSAPTGIWLGGSQHTDPGGSSQSMDGYLRKVRLSSVCRYPNGTAFTPSSVFPI